MNVIGVLTLCAGGREMKHAACIHGFQCQSARHQRIEDAVQRHTIDRCFFSAAQPGLQLSVAQRLPSRMQGIEHAHPTARHLHAGGTNQIGRD